MKRTASRPLPAGRLDPQTALHFGVGLAAFSVFLMLFAANWQAAALLTLSILFYVFVYTMWLKPRTPQNIVIGGAAGAFPPLIGWVAATGSIAPLPVMLFLLIFLWTPPHFWALALFVRSDYAAAGIPMMPVVAGEQSTRRQILFYALIMAAAAIAPWPLGYAGALYGWAATLLSAFFVLLSVRVGLRQTGAGDKMQPEKRLFGYSVAYLFLIFTAVVIDHMLAL
jgi:protoheme IX farnesyltransferase